jgi:hypothetical protein
MASALDRLRDIALALPEVSERQSHGAPCFFVRDKKALCYFHDDHRGDGRVSLWCPAPPGVQEEMVDSEPERFFKPPTSASGSFSNWLGVFLDTAGEDRVDWDEIATLLEDGFRTVAPTELVAVLDRHQHHRPAPQRNSAAPRYRFHAELWMHTGEAAWHFVTLPTDIADEIHDLSAPTSRGFGSVRVAVTLGSTTWHTSVFPDTASGSFVLPIKRQVRTREGLRDGDRVDVIIEVTGGRPTSH